MNCNYCHKKFTNKSRKEMKCPSCSSSICKSCLSKKINENPSQSSCLSCYNPYTEEILKDLLSKTVFQKWEKENNKIEKIHVIGSGGFGECSLIKKRGNFLIMKEPIKRGLESSFQNEINVHKLLDHPNIVPFYESFIKRGKPHILLYPCIYGSLHDLLNKMDFPIENKKIIIRQVITGMEYLLSMKVIHRDLKQHNLLFDESMKIRIGDFGLSKVLEDGQLCYSNCGTTKFKAPEVLKREGYSFEVDRWSLGIIIYYLFLGEYPFEHRETRKIEQKILKHKYIFPPHSTEEEKEFIDWILNPNPKERPTLQEIKIHEFLRE